MTHGQRSIAVSRLLLDERNARLGDEQSGQQATVVALAKLLGSQLIDLAGDIIENGLDPTTLITVTPEADRNGYYRVIEGNRRVLALKALDTPALVDAALTPARRKRLAELAEAHRQAPIGSVTCVVFDSESNARHWIELRHTGSNSGVGLVEWDSNEKDRYKARHGGSADRSPAGQVMDFVDSLEAPPAESKPIITTLKRLISTPLVREKLGIEVRDGKVYSFYPAEEVLKGLREVVDDLRSGAVKVSDVYMLGDRESYMAAFDPDLLPDPATKLDRSVELTKLSIGDTPAPALPSPAPQPTAALTSNPVASPTPSPGTSPNHSVPGSSSSNSPTQTGQGIPSQPPVTAVTTRVYPPRQRTVLIPSSCALYISDPRIKKIYHELRRLGVDQFTNVAAVGLRVFIELSVDHHLAARNIMNEQTRNTTKLAKRLKDLADHMHAAGEIPQGIQRVIMKVADGSTGTLSASTFTFNQYVHNQYAFPRVTELLASWDELQPFMQALWKK